MNKIRDRGDLFPEGVRPLHFRILRRNDSLHSK
jgi:hypothetical protein